jgi:hypothetical protein
MEVENLAFFQIFLAGLAKLKHPVYFCKQKKMRGRLYRVKSFLHNFAGN